MEMEETQQPPNAELKRKAEEDITEGETGIFEPASKSAKYEEGEKDPCETSLTGPTNEIHSTIVNSNDEEIPLPLKTVPSTKVEDLARSKECSIDPLGYTKAEEFTSEIFKIQIHNMPKFGYSDFKKRLASLGLKPHKIKSPGREVTYVCFRNESDRQTALEKINGHVWRGKKLEAKEAAPSVDPFLEKKRQQRNQKSDTTDKQPLTFEEAQKKLKDNVTPLWEMDYSKQLETKAEKIRSELKRLTHHQLVREQFRRMESWKQDGMPCPLLPIVPSPVMSNYRNKNEFTVGYSQDGETIKVGFRYGLYKDGTTSVGDATDIGVVKPDVVPVIESFEKFVSKSRWAPYLQQTSTGHWHTLVVRSFDSGDIMAMVDFHPRGLDRNELAQAKDSIKDFYTSGDGKDVDIKSFFFRLYAKGPEGVPKLEKIYGDSHVHESLLGLKFRISPEAFFQVNTKATEKLYCLIGEWCEASASSIILDICCGTGTIGLSLAKKVRHVIGVEMCEPAVDDAKENASLNGITNVTYYCSKVEDIIGRVLTSAFNVSLSSSSPPPPSSSPSPSSLPTSLDPALSSESLPSEKLTNESDIIAVVDPPRAGLHKSVIKMLRKTEEIKKLVYVSCNPASAMDNFVDLIRPSSSKLKGCSFTLKKAVPVDLFPGTRHCELVLLLTR